MNFDQYLKTVTNLDKYISFSWDVQNQRIDLKVSFNISTIISLKNIRSLEIEYFNKCEENGGALKIVKLLLRSPPSKTWSLLGGELISVLKYWLEAMRKHLILHNIHWWTFLKAILKFIRDISSKDVSLNNCLIEETAECLLDLATHHIPDENQRSEIIQTFNTISAQASRSIRFDYKEKFKSYFSKLSTQLVSAGAPLQHRALEALLRWLVPRHDPAVRRAAADVWFPQGMYSERAVRVFMERPWQDFIKDARDFLNAQNESGTLVTSVVCKTFSVGPRVCFTATRKSECWLDVNKSTGCLSILVDPRWGGALGGDGSCDAVIVGEDNTISVELKRESGQLLITASVLDLSLVYPFGDVTTGDVIRIAVSTRSDLVRLDASLRAVFGEKYQNSLELADVGDAMSLSPDRLSNSDVINGTEEEKRFSMPLEVRRRKHSGYAVKPRNPGSWNSPSTVSTSSLAQLHEKLAALPRYTFDKEPVSVCALPQLSTVSEVSETGENHTNNSSLSTIKYRRYGVCQKRSNKTVSKHSTSDESNEIRHLSPVVNDDENSISCLLLATIGSADDSVISDTVGRLPKNIPCNTDNIVDLLAQEALESNVNIGVDSVENRKILDKQTDHLQSENPFCSNPSDDNKITRVLLENPLPGKQQVTDESSNDIVENTPYSLDQFKTFKRNAGKKKSNSNTLPKESDGVSFIHNVETVENFFSQHVTENRNGDIVISPTLARKINETSSECSDDLDQFSFRADKSHEYIVQDIEISLIDQLIVTDSDIVECVNAMVDRVCQDLDKCAKYIHMVDEFREVGINSRPRRTLRKTALYNTAQDNQEPKKTVKSKPKPKEKLNKPVKLKFTKRNTMSSKKTSKTVNQPEKQPPFELMSPIIERDSTIDDTALKNVVSRAESPETPLLRRKRKLYSPKDETCHEKINLPVIETSQDENIQNNQNSGPEERSKTSKTVATCYKELEQERKKRIRRPRNRLSLKRPETTVSPRTLKMNETFDALKNVIDGEPVKLVDKNQLKNDKTVYNYTSEEDDDEKNANTNSTLKNVPSPVIGCPKIDKPVKTTTNKTAKKTVKRVQKLRTKRSVSKKCEKENVTNILEAPKLNLEDERMRKETPEILNISLIEDSPKDPEMSPDKQPEPILNVVPQMDRIVENNCKTENRTKENLRKTKRTLSLKRNKEQVHPEPNMADNDGTLSPLPGLVVETVLTTEFDINDSVSSNMLQKLKDIYQGKRPVDSETNNTQNLLSDTNEPINYSPTNLNVTEELNRDVKKQNESIKKEPKKKKPVKRIKKTEVAKIKLERHSKTLESHVIEEPSIIELSVSKANSEKSMATMGNSQSPITGHGDFDEVPPNRTLLKEDIQPRIVEQEYLNESIKDFFRKLTEQLNETNTDIKSLDEDNKSDDDPTINTGSNRSLVVAVARLSPDNIRSIISDSSSIHNSNSKYNPTLKSPKVNSNSNLNDCIVEESKPLAKTRSAMRSVISPIKLCEDFKLQDTKKTSARSSKDECLKRVKSIFSSKKSAKQQNSTDKINTTTCSRNQKNIVKSANKIFNTAESLKSEGTTSSKASKRKLSSTPKSSKRSKYSEVNNNFGSTIESGPSISSVNEWFKRNNPTNRAESVKLSIRENLNNVLEKIDTTLVEIHHNTSKRFINMFVEATARLSDLKEQRQALQRQTAADIMSNVVKVVDEKFLDLSNRLKSMDDQFMESLKKQAHDLIREECTQKRAMVTLLREDVQAVLDHLENARGSH